MDKVHKKTNSKDEWQKRIVKLEQQRLGETQALLEKTEDPKKMCRKLYEYSLKTGLYHTARMKQDTFLSSLYKSLCNQRDILAQCAKARIAYEKMIPSGDIKEMSQCSLDPTVAIKLCLAS